MHCLFYIAKKTMEVYTVTLKNLVPSVDALVTGRVSILTLIVENIKMYVTLIHFEIHTN